MAKAAKVQAANDAPAAGHNSSEMTAEERKALFFDHYRPIAAQLEVVREAQAAYKKLRKNAKAEGIALWEIDYALKCAEVDDETIIPSRIKRETEIAAWFALPVDFQPDMFGDFSREPSEERARREGAKAGATGYGSNPHDENSVPGKAWAEAFAFEQTKHREAMQARMERQNSLIKGAPSSDDPFEEPRVAAE